MRIIKSRAFAIFLTLSLFQFFIPAASANITLENTTLGSKVTTQDSNCGSLVLGNNSLFAGTTSTVDIIFSLSSTANPAATQALMGGQPGAMNILINGGSSFKRIDLDFGLNTIPFYLQSDAALVPGTTYHIAVQNNGTTTRVWINGAALTTSSGSTGINLSASQARGTSKPITQIGDFYGTSHGKFQGKIKYLRISTTFDYLMTSDTVTMSNTLPNNASTAFLLTPATVIPTYSLITSASYSNPYVTFVGTNNFASGDLITIKTASAPANYTKVNGTVFSATSSSFVVNYGASTPGTWTGLGSAVTTAVTKDDTGNTSIAWYDGVCSTANGSPGMIVSVISTLVLLGGGNSATYRTPTTLQTSVAVPGKVTFFQGGKRISKCTNLSYGVGTASCNWSPANHGYVALTVVLTPTDASLYSSVPGYLQVFVFPRLSAR
jgi:hypothetical protein